MTALSSWSKLPKKQRYGWTEKKGPTDIEDDLRLGKFEMLISLNDEGRSMNLDEARITRTVRAAYFGEEVSRLQRGRHEVKLMVRFPERDRKSMGSFDEIRVRDNNGVEFPLSSVANVEYRRASSENQSHEWKTIHYGYG